MEDFNAFVLMRIFSTVRMNAMALLKNANKGVSSLSKSYTLTCPMVVNEGVDNDQALQVAKVVEHRFSVMCKAIIENTTFDSAYDATMNNIMKFLPIRHVPGVSGGTYGISVAGVVNGDVANVINESETKERSDQIDIMTTLINESFNDIAFNDPYVKDVILEDNILEADDNIIKDKNANPTRFIVEIPYITGKGEIKTVKNTISVEIVTRVVKNLDLHQTIARLDPKMLFNKYIKLKKKEISLVKDFLLDINNIETLARANAIDNNNILNVISRENISNKLKAGQAYPFAFLFVDKDFVDTVLRSSNLDLENESTMRSIMKSMSMIGMMVYDSGTDMMKSLYSGDRYAVDMPYDEYVDAIGKYEKELKTLVRLGGN